MITNTRKKWRSLKATDHWEEFKGLVQRGDVWPAELFEDLNTGRVNIHIRGIRADETWKPVLVGQGGGHRHVGHLEGRGSIGNDWHILWLTVKPVIHDKYCIEGGCINPDDFLGLTRFIWMSICKGICIDTLKYQYLTSRLITYWYWIFLLFQSFLSKHKVFQTYGCWLRTL